LGRRREMPVLDGSMIQLSIRTGGQPRLERRREMPVLDGPVI
jgi:hypothetical protein